MKEAYFIYDGTFEGLLTGIFDSYDKKRLPIKIVQRHRANEHLFGEELRVITNPQKADRVAKKLREISPAFFNHLAMAFNSQEEGIEMLLFNLICISLKEQGKNPGNFSHPDQLRLMEIVEKIQGEIQRMLSLVHFQRLADSIWLSTVEPVFDLLPFLSNHFKNRNANQKWVVYDLARDYGLYYNLHNVQALQIENEALLRQWPSQESIPEEEESGNQQLWKNFFSSANMASAHNTKLCIKHLPRRYWPYLSEK